MRSNVSNTIFITMILKNRFRIIYSKYCTPLINKLNLNSSKIAFDKGSIKQYKL